MIRHRLGLCAFLAGTLAAGCGGDDPAEPPTATPPDLSGTYDLQSFTSVALTGGNVLTDLEGTLTLLQTGQTGNEATGTFNIAVTVPDGEGGFTRFLDQGTYAVQTDGSWEQTGRIFQGTGTFTLEGSNLTVNVVSPALSASTSIWRKQ